MNKLLYLLSCSLLCININTAMHAGIFWSKPHNKIDATDKNKIYITNKRTGITVLVHMF